MFGLWNSERLKLLVRQEGRCAFLAKRNNKLKTLSQVDRKRAGERTARSATATSRTAPLLTS